MEQISILKRDSLKNNLEEFYNKEELIDIANKLDDDPTLRYCPHGRPVCVVMTKYELEKQFGRV